MAVMWTCRCGAANKAAADECDFCGLAKSQRAQEGPESPAKACSVCGHGFVYWTGLIRAEDGSWLCTPCRLGWLERRMSKPGDRCQEPGCDMTTQQHIDEFRHVVSGPEWGRRFTSDR